MKKITLLFVGVLMSAFTYAGRGVETPKTESGMAVVKNGGSSFKLIYKSEFESDVKVQIFNDQNLLVFSEIIKGSSGFARPYNFTRLKEGVYTIKLDNGSNWMTETLNYESVNTEKLAQLIQLNDGKFLLTVAGHGEDVISIKVRNGNDETIYSERTPVYGDFAQVYDLGAIKGNFAFEIKDQNGASKTLRK